MIKPIPIRVRGLDVPDDFMQLVRERYQAELELRLVIARDAGMRLAARALDEPSVGFIGSVPNPAAISEMSWEFVMLSPGESPPGKGPWTVYEFRGDQAVGRSA